MAERRDAADRVQQARADAVEAAVAAQPDIDEDALEEIASASLRDSCSSLSDDEALVAAAATPVDEAGASFAVTAVMTSQSQDPAALEAGCGFFERLRESASDLSLRTYATRGLLHMRLRAGDADAARDLAVDLAAAGSPEYRGMIVVMNPAVERTEDEAREALRDLDAFEASIVEATRSLGAERGPSAAEYVSNRVGSVKRRFEDARLKVSVRSPLLRDARHMEALKPIAERWVREKRAAALDGEGEGREPFMDLAPSEPKPDAATVSAFMKSLKV